jgi:hypothetical protein
MLNTSSTWLSKITLEDDLTAAGFSRNKGRSGYTLNGLTFTLDDNWPVLKSKQWPITTDPLKDLIGKPGFWKCINKKGRVHEQFDLPPSVVGKPAEDLDEFDLGDDVTSPLLSMLEWALDTIDGDVPSGWSAPERKDVEAMIPREGLTVQCGVHARQGELLCEPNLFALQFQILPTVPENLAGNRMNWLRHLLFDTQNRWRLVRIGFIENKSGLSVRAEVDLTGAPRAVLPDLVPVALFALRSVVEWVVEPAVFLVNGTDDCSALEIDLLYLETDEAPEKGGGRDDCNKS